MARRIVDERREYLSEFAIVEPIDGELRRLFGFHEILLILGMAMKMLLAYALPSVLLFYLVGALLIH